MIPTNAAANNPYYQNMFDPAIRVKLGIKTLSAYVPMSMLLANVREDFESLY